MNVSCTLNTGFLNPVLQFLRPEERSHFLVSKILQYVFEYPKILGFCWGSHFHAAKKYIRYARLIIRNQRKNNEFNFFDAVNYTRIHFQKDIWIIYYEISKSIFMLLSQFSSLFELFWRWSLCFHDQASKENKDFCCGNGIFSLTIKLFFFCFRKRSERDQLWRHTCTGSHLLQVTYLVPVCWTHCCTKHSWSRTWLESQTCFWVCNRTTSLDICSVLVPSEQSS